MTQKTSNRRNVDRVIENYKNCKAMGDCWRQNYDAELKKKWQEGMMVFDLLKQLRVQKYYLDV